MAAHREEEEKEEEQADECPQGAIGFWRSKIWLSHDGEDLGWSWGRVKAAKLVTSQSFEVFMGVIITFNAGTIIWETDYTAQCFPAYSDDTDNCPYNSNSVPWLSIVNRTLLCLYTAELVMRLYVFRLSFFGENWNNLDAFVVVLGWIAAIFDGVLNLAFIRLVRLARLTRAMRVLRAIRELYLLINGIMSSLRTIFFGCSLIFIALMGTGILMVEWVHPVSSQMEFYDCPECSNAFRSVGYSVITLFKELIAGGSWVMSLSLWEKSPGAIFLMIATTVTVTLGFMNLILTVIVEQAAEARAKDVEEMARRKSQEKSEALKDLLKFCEKIDKNGDGMLSIEEVMGAFDRSVVFRNLMTAMDMTPAELHIVFRMADTQDTGLVNYESFCHELFQLKSRDQSMLLAMVTFSMQATQDMIKQIAPKLEELAKQGQVSSAQMNVLDQKIDHLKVSEKLEHVQSSPPGATLYGIGVHPPAKKPLCEPHPCVLKHHSCTQAISSQTACMQEWGNFDHLQQELQNLLDTSRFLVGKAIQDIDISPPRLTEALSALMRVDGAICSSDIKTLEVWLSERKYQQFKSTVQTQRDQLIEQHNEPWEDTPVPTEHGRDSVSSTQQVLSQLKHLLVQLLQNDAHEVPKEAVAGCASN